MRIFYLFTCVLLILGGCHSKNDPNQIRVGTISGPETQLMRVAQQVALKQTGLQVKITEFSDYSLPNRALNDGSLEANLFQHQRFLNAEIKNKQYALVPIATFFIYPMGIYSNKIHQLDALRQNALVAIPNDPSNEARALLLLQQAGLLQLKTNATRLATPRDILSNPKHLQLKELDAAQLTRALPDVDVALINTNYAVLAKRVAQQGAFYWENKNSSYANLLVVRDNDKNNPKFNALIRALHSPEVLAAAKTLFHAQAIPAWK